MMKAILSLLRVKNLVIIILTQYFVSYFLIRPFYQLNGFEPSMTDFAFALMVLATVLITAAGYIVNDYFDIEIDKINKPGKNIVGTLISVSAARMLYFTFNVIAGVIGFWLAYKIEMLQLSIVMILIMLILWSYSKKYKRQMLYGNFVVAVMSAFSIYMVWLFELFFLRLDANAYAQMFAILPSINYFALGLTFFAFFVSLIREIVKDMEDVEGDQAENCQTLPLVVGIRRSRTITAGIFVLLIASAAIGQYYLWMNEFVFLFWYFSLIIQPLFIFTFVKLIKSEEKKDFHFVSNALKVIMLTGILSVLLLQLNF